MKTSFSIVSFAIVFASLGSLLGTQGCGKNMNLALKNKSTPDQPSNNEINGGGDVRRQTREGYPNLQGGLEPYSVFDFQDPSLKPLNPALAGSHPFTQIGKSDDGYVIDSNVLFRAIHAVPAAKDVIYIKDMKLVLEGVTRFAPNGKAGNLEGQVLCLLANATGSQHHCMGVRPEKANPEFWKGDDKNSELKSDALSQITLEEELVELSDQTGKVFGKKTENKITQNVTIDLLAAFKMNCDPALKGTDLAALEACGQKQMKWLESVSSVFAAKTGHRKFRFSLAPQTYVNAGQLVLAFEHRVQTTGTLVDTAKNATAAAHQSLKTLPPQDYANGPTDGEIAVIDRPATVEATNPATAGDQPAVDVPKTISTQAPQLVAPQSNIPQGESNAVSPTKEPARTFEPAQVPSVQSGREDLVLNQQLAQKLSDEAVKQHLERVKGTRPVSTESAPLATLDAEPETPAQKNEVLAPVQIPAPVVVIIQNPAKDAQKADIKLDLYDLVLKFKVNEAAIAKKDLPKLKATAQLLNDSEKYLDRLFLIGHTSVTGSKDFNQALSEKRAKAVKYQLTQKFGLRATVAASGVGSPKVSSCAPVRECDKDRRVELKIRLSDTLKTAQADPVELQRIRDNIADALRQIWESNTEVQKN